MGIEWVLNAEEALDDDFERLRTHINLGDLDGSTLLLTGATGFFGVWLVELLAWARRRQGVNVEVYLLSRDVKKFDQRIPIYRSRPWIHLVEGDVRSFQMGLKSIDYIIHGATDTSASAGARGFEIVDVIYQGTRHVLEIAHHLKCKRLLFLSSGAVYGSAQGNQPFVETDVSAPDLSKPGSAYGEGKRVGELLATLAVHQVGLDVVSARCFAFVGAGLPMSGHFAIGNFIRDALENRDILLKSTGRSLRSYLYAADLAIWLYSLLLRGDRGACYNVGSSHAVSVLQTAEVVKQTLNPSLSVQIARDASDAWTTYVPSTELAQSRFGLEAWTSLDLSIQRLADQARLWGPFRTTR